MKTTPQERLALGVIALLLAGGAGARALRSGPEPAVWTGLPVEAPPLGTVKESLEREQARSKPLEPGERIDVNTATTDELVRLPKVGAALAKTIFENRPYRSLADLDEVSGVGPAVLEAIKDRVTFGGAPSSESRPPAQRPRSLHSAPPSDGGGKVSLSRATAAELEALPDVGPALAAAIIEYRRKHGGFRSVAELDSVPGIGPAKFGKLAPLVSP